MRFRRWPRVEAYVDTPRKRAAFARSQRLQREKLPLFADLVAETPNPARFDEAFRQIGRKPVGGGPKTTPADETLFRGNLGSVCSS